MLKLILFYRVILLLTCCVAFIFAQLESTPDAMAQLADLLGLSQASARLKRQPSLRCVLAITDNFFLIEEELKYKQFIIYSNSAAKFLLEVYKELSDEDEKNLPEVLQNLHKTRHRRALSEDNFITPFDRREIELSNNIITFASRRECDILYFEFITAISLHYSMTFLLQPCRCMRFLHIWATCLSILI